jgi:hypothetical protein
VQYLFIYLWLYFILTILITEDDHNHIFFWQLQLRWFVFITYNKMILSNRIIQFTCNAVNTHLNHRRIFLFSRPCGVGPLLCMRNINCKPHWLAICCLSVWIWGFLKVTSHFHKLYNVSPFAPKLNFLTSISSILLNQPSMDKWWIKIVCM